MRTGSPAGKRLSCSCFGACASTTQISSSSSGADRQRLVLQQEMVLLPVSPERIRSEAVADQRVFPGDELRVFAGQRDVTLEGDGAIVLRQAREIRHQHMVGRGEDDQVFPAVVR